MNVNFGEREVLEIKSKSIDGFTFIIKARATTVNSAFSATLLDYEKVIIKCTLSGRGKKDHVIYQGTAFPLFVSSCYFNAGFGQILDGTSAVTLPAASGVDELAQQMFKVDFGTVINLKGDECISFEVYVPSGSGGTDVSEAESHVEFDVHEAVGYEYGTPEINAISLSNNQARIQKDLGDNVVDITFTNSDKTNILATNQVIETVTLTSDRLSYSDSQNELFTKRWSMFYDQTQADNRHQCYKLLNGESIDDVSLDMSFTTTNVNSGKNYVVVKKLHTTKGHLARVQNYKDKHNREFLAKL